MKPYDILKESIEFGSKQLEDFKATKSLNNVSTIVIAALYRKIIELSEGVRVSGANGLSGPALLSYRGLIEAYLAFKYILQDEALLEDRAKAYKIGYHKEQIDAGNYGLEKASNDDEKKFFELAIQHHTSEIEKEDFQEVLTVYNELQSRDRRGFIPKWYALNGGPTSIKKLAEFIAEAEETDRETVAKLYNFLSTDAHSYMALRSIVEKDGDLSIKPVRIHFNSDKDEYNFIPTRSLLTSTILKFMQSTFPENESNVEIFAQRIVPYLSY
ncbi:DUF5677 domain-containing protein [Lysinibacillus xylanilyticus]|uniref:DUF5677 domain-containing protein n=1 Tax=Lysinibacillus xylanilyticus TaxID=582475 RepID=UPI002B23F987|nr:DUF5677 domain-containing protein [Lysinibacillus xylanilyticus]MEB2301598.1 DUF5677 domain-containing protein [Lysinibacillus xylanilyticus]